MNALLLRCAVCGGLIDEEDLFCANCGTEAPARGTAGALSSATDTHAFQCEACGASMHFDASDSNLRCPFCDSTDLARRGEKKVLAPERVVPFAVERDAALAAMKQWLGKSFWRPADLVRKARVASIRAVYVPYWVYRANTHTYWTADTSQTPPGASGDWYPLFGEHRERYAGLLVPASGALSQAETAALAPFGLERGVAPSEVDLENVTVEQFGVLRKTARAAARAGIENLERQTVQGRYVPGRSRNVHVNVRISDLAGEPVLLPVWILAYRYRDRAFRLLVNGLTGKVTGEAPFSWLKVLAVAALAGGLALAILLFLAVLGALFAS